MRIRGNTPGFIGGLIGFVLGLAISFGATISIRAAYNQASAEMEGGTQIDPIGLTYRSLADQETQPPASPPTRLFRKSQEEVEVTEAAEVRNEG